MKKSITKNIILYQAQSGRLDTSCCDLDRVGTCMEVLEMVQKGKTKKGLGGEALFLA